MTATTILLAWSILLPCGGPVKNAYPLTYMPSSSNNTESRNFFAGLVESLLESMEDEEAPLHVNHVPIYASEAPLSIEEATRHPKHYYCRGEAVYLMRPDFDGDDLAFSTQDGSMLAAGGGSTVPSAGGGMGLTLGRYLNTNNSFEVEFWFSQLFGNARFDADQYGPLFRPFSGADHFQPTSPINGSPVDLVKIEQKMSVVDLEFNHRYLFGNEWGQRLRAGVLTGVRTMYVADRFRDYEYEHAFAATSDRNSLYEAEAYNRLLGGQLGLILDWRPLNSVALVSETKYALMGNWAGGEHSFQLLSTKETLFGGRHSELRCSGAADLQLTLKYRPSSWLELWVGYQALYLQNMAGGQGQIHLDLSHQRDSLDSDSYWVHGPRLSLVLRTVPARRRPSRRNGTPPFESAPVESASETPYHTFDTGDGTK